MFRKRIDEICSKLENLQNKNFLKTGASLADLRKFGRNYDEILMYENMLFEMA